MKIIILIALLLLTSINGEKPSAKNSISIDVELFKQGYRQKMTKVKELRLPLEKGTPFYSDNVQFLPQSNTLIIRFNGKIISYNILSATENFNFKIASEGESGIKEQIGALHYVSNDSIFVSETYTGVIHRLNSKGKLHETYDSYMGTDPLYPQPGMDQGAPLLYKDGTFFVGGYMATMGISKSKKSKFLISYNIEDNEKKYILDVPQRLSQGSWIPKSQVYYTIDRDRIIASFHISDSIFLYDLNSNNVDRFLAKSAMFNEEDIKPFSEEINVPYDSKIKDLLIDYNTENPSYDMTLFDQWNNLYYRFARLPTTIEMIYEEKFPDKVLMVFDKDFKKLAEQVLPSEYFHKGAFVSPDGLMLPNRVKYEENDNFLTYDAFTILK